MTGVLKTMYIKEIILDGFKSYATRTVVSGFDKSFNAITGLNGSGKSNILDSICFVLGITQLSQVRVSNLQGLVYKQGQAGVTKASVTIVFDNSDSKQSPVGYEQYNEITITRQIVIGGKNKYLINGHNAQAAQVQNLFHSVQLNVNNPHFLIMQGRITKVLNMKPPEILGMIEEAAGTRMYESKKVAAEKKMEQKQVKVDEIEKLLSEEITPKLDKLRSQKQTYLKWAANNTELERVQRFCVAYAFTEKSEFLNSSEEALAKMKATVEKYREESTALSEQKQALIEMKAKLQQRLEKELNDKVSKLSLEEESASKSLVKGSSQLEIGELELERTKKKIESLQTRQQEAVKRLGDLQDSLAKAEADNLAAQKALAIAEGKHKAAQSDLQAANAGMEGSGREEGGPSATLTERLSQAKCAVEVAACAIKQNQLKLDHARKEAKKLQLEIEDTENEDSEIVKAVALHKKHIGELKRKIEALNYSEQKIDLLVQQQAELEDKRSVLKEKVDTLSSKLAAFNFAYDKPSRDFDESKVKGLVAKLIQIKDKSFATALEVVAGGKLFQVVVDSSETGKALLKNGNLKKRVTIIPLDKVSNRSIPKPKQEVANKLAKGTNGNAQVALSLVGYDDELRAAMQYVFGTAFICDTIETARRVTFSKDVRVRSVTLEGDSFDPQGTLSGGSRNAGGSVLLRLDALARAEQELAVVESQLTKVSGQIEEMRQNKVVFRELSQQLQAREQEFSLLEAKAGETPYAKLMAAKAELDASINTLTENIHRERENRSRHEDEAKEIEEKMQDMDSARTKLIEKAVDQLNQAKADLTKVQQAATVAQEAEDLARLEVDELLQEQNTLHKTIDESELEFSQTQENVAQMKVQVNATEEMYKKMQETLSVKKNELKKLEGEISGMNKSIADVTERIQECQIGSTKIEGKLKRFNKDEKEAQKSLKTLLKKHPWIESEKEFFGKPHTDYDFEGKDPDEAEERREKLEEAQAQLAQKINKKVMGMIEKAEQEYNDLNRKRAIIEKDRKTIERVIEGLDQKKNEALKSTYAKVNKDFGSIFSTLLTGASARLDPPEGGTVLDGLEVKVAFGNTWKESLTELSGGQRSLIALSLILALLLFKPAPMYILDEVDAALDLSHTQNIGQMLRTHFAHSQFIVVSLKEGMFNNANVIFRTKFLDGVSTVTRTGGATPDKENEAQEKKAKSKRAPNAAARSKARAR